MDTPQETGYSPITKKHAIGRRGVADLLKVQVDGDHYKEMTIQPVEFIHANGIGYFEGNVIKYVSRWRSKGGLSDLHKAAHYISLLIALETQDANDV